MPQVKNYIFTSCAYEIPRFACLSFPKPIPLRIAIRGCASELYNASWSKGIPPELLADWKEAETLIADATQLRFLGYSLPAGDARVRYLLKTAIASGQRVKRIDVICKDTQGGEVRGRYEDFVRFPNWNFSNTLVEEYLKGIAQAHRTKSDATGAVKEFKNLETAHLSHMDASSSR